VKRRRRASRCRGPVYSEGSRLLGLVVAGDGKRAAVAHRLRISESFVSRLVLGQEAPGAMLMYRIWKAWPGIPMHSWCELVTTEVALPLGRSTAEASKGTVHSSPLQERGAEDNADGRPQPALSQHSSQAGTSAEGPGYSARQDQQSRSSAESDQR